MQVSWRSEQTQSTSSQPRLPVLTTHTVLPGPVNLWSLFPRTYFFLPGAFFRKTFFRRKQGASLRESRSACPFRSRAGALAPGPSCRAPGSRPAWCSVTPLPARSGSVSWCSVTPLPNRVQCHAAVLWHPPRPLPNRARVLNGSSSDPLRLRGGQHPLRLRGGQPAAPPRRRSVLDAAPPRRPAPAAPPRRPAAAAPTRSAPAAPTGPAPPRGSAAAMTGRDQLRWCSRPV